ncbi:MAG: HU family DNA-binding protein, partial [Gammaproteobacteria bacterium]|nr:HU family DNA-binding protein [Gammaproteobacteria bacterium]
MTVTKAELTEALFNEVGFNRREAKDFVELFFEEIRVSLESGVPVKLSGFGTVSLRAKNPRPGRTPNTGVEIPVSA